MNYRDMLTFLVGSSGTELLPGMTILYVWRDKEHLEEWYTHSVKNSTDVRVARLPSSYLPEMDKTGGVSKDDVTMIGIALSAKEDYSDTICLYYIAVIPK